MRAVILSSQIEEIKSSLDEDVFKYISANLTDTYEEHANYSLIAFDWYDTSIDDHVRPQILIYLDHEDLFFLCENDKALEFVKKILPPENVEQANDKVLYAFFRELIKGDFILLEKFENEITNKEDTAMENNDHDGYIIRITEYRKKLMHLKHYYEQLVDIIDNIADNDNSLLSDDAIRHFGILESRTERLLHNVINLRDYVTQMREAFQAQIDIEQNDIMRVFTVLTAVFLPLTLMVGWYGMNFTSMKEITWPYSYPVFIAVSILLVVVLIFYFKKKKWF
jgi:magnesium transporter